MHRPFLDAAAARAAMTETLLGAWFRRRWTASAGTRPTCLAAAAIVGGVHADSGFSCRVHRGAAGARCCPCSGRRRRQPLTLMAAARRRAWPAAPGGDLAGGLRLTGRRPRGEPDERGSLVGDETVSAFRSGPWCRNRHSDQYDVCVVRSRSDSLVPRLPWASELVSSARSHCHDD